MATWPTRGQQAPDFWDVQLKEYIDEGDTGGGGGAVTSVNGETGAVDLSAADVDAIPAGDITIIDVMTQAAYDALTPKVATTLYVIVG